MVILISFLATIIFGVVYLKEKYYRNNVTNKIKHHNMKRKKVVYRLEIGDNLGCLIVFIVILAIVLFIINR